MATCPLAGAENAGLCRPSCPVGCGCLCTFGLLACWTIDGDPEVSFVMLERQRGGGWAEVLRSEGARSGNSRKLTCSWVRGYDPFRPQPPEEVFSPSL